MHSVKCRIQDYVYLRLHGLWCCWFWIVNRVEWLWSLSDSFVMCIMFSWTWRCTMFSSIPIILIFPTNKNNASIYYVPICEQRVVHCQRAPNINWSSVVVFLIFSSTFPEFGRCVGEPSNVVFSLYFVCVATCTAVSSSKRSSMRTWWIL